MTFQLVNYGFSRWIANDTVGQTTFQTWSANLRHGFEWDNDHFPVNQLAHPYSGNLYFNSARANGYDFWSSAPFVLGGSLIWEYFGETQRPSINDLINTTLGGINMGETLFRLSNLILDRHTTGITRVVREIGSAVVDPPLALSRFLNGEIGQVEPNPVNRVPSRLASEVNIGYQRVSQGAAESPLTKPNQGFVFYSLDYGDPLRGDVAHPFGAFRADITIATNTTGVVSEAHVLGYLLPHEFSHSEDRHQQWQVGLNYDYLNNQAVLAGGQGVSGIFIARQPIARSLSLRTEVSAIGYVIDGVKSDFSPNSADSSTARNYDYGMGGGGRIDARIERHGNVLLETVYQNTWIGVLSGAARDHRYDVLSARLEVPIVGELAVGGSALLYHRTSRYATHETVYARDARTQVFIGVLF
jgi:hypothetical protein